MNPEVMSHDPATLSIPGFADTHSEPPTTTSITPQWLLGDTPREQQFQTTACKWCACKPFTRCCVLLVSQDNPTFPTASFACSHIISVFHYTIFSSVFATFDQYDICLIFMEIIYLKFNKVSRFRCEWIHLGTSILTRLSLSVYSYILYSIIACSLSCN